MSRFITCSRCGCRYDLDGRDGCVGCDKIEKKAMQDAKSAALGRKMTTGYTSPKRSGPHASEDVEFEGLMDVNPGKRRRNEWRGAWLDVYGHGDFESGD